MVEGNCKFTIASHETYAGFLPVYSGLAAVVLNVRSRLEIHVRWVRRVCGRRVLLPDELLRILWLPINHVAVVPRRGRVGIGGIDTEGYRDRIIKRSCVSTVQKEKNKEVLSVAINEA